MTDLYRKLLHLCLALAVLVIGLGAYVRLSDAGLGCPDWPGCYGELVKLPENAVDPGRAAIEMTHRWLAGSFGLLVLMLFAVSWRYRRRFPTALPTLLLAVVTGQALLGMLTVTLQLKPLVVSAHLLGGMSVLALLVWLRWRLHPVRRPASAGTRWLALFALAALAVQIALGGWVSSNYAALACTGFPDCSGSWFPDMDFATAFTLHRPLGEAGHTALVAIHWTHRLAAIGVTALVGLLAVRLMQQTGWHGWAWRLALALSLQVMLGIANTLLERPLPLAVAHNLGAALLLALLVAVNCRLRPPLAQEAP